MKGGKTAANTFQAYREAQASMRPAREGRENVVDTTVADLFDELQ